MMSCWANWCRCGLAGIIDAHTKQGSHEDVDEFKEELQQFVHTAENCLIWDDEILGNLPACGRFCRRLRNLIKSMFADRHVFSTFCGSLFNMVSENLIVRLCEKRSAQSLVLFQRCRLRARPETRLQKRGQRFLRRPASLLHPLASLNRARLLTLRPFWWVIQ